MLKDYATSLHDAFATSRYNYTPNDIARIRTTLRMSTPEFSRLFFADKSTVVKWESGDRVPSGSSLRLLQFAEAMADGKHPPINRRIRQAYKNKYGAERV